MFVTSVLMAAVQILQGPVNRILGLQIYVRIFLQHGRTNEARGSTNYATLRLRLVGDELRQCGVSWVSVAHLHGTCATVGLVTVVHLHATCATVGSVP
jgi:hypothetical protein